MKLAIVDYGMGNILSLSSALNFIGVNETLFANDHDSLSKADKIILPGVGNFAMAAAKIHDLGLDAILNDLVIENKKPIGNGIITCLNKKQAIARKKKGAEAANAIISILSQK